MQIWHLTFDSEGRSVFFPDEGLRRAAVLTTTLSGSRLRQSAPIDGHGHGHGDTDHGHVPVPNPVPDPAPYQDSRTPNTWVLER